MSYHVLNGFVISARFSAGRMYSRPSFDGSSGVPFSGWPKISSSSPL
jgi:hypothetical protein